MAGTQSHRQSAEPEHRTLHGAGHTRTVVPTLKSLSIVVELNDRDIERWIIWTDVDRKRFDLEMAV
jgi:hypothetical protein